MTTRRGFFGRFLGAAAVTAIPRSLLPTTAAALKPFRPHRKIGDTIVVRKPQRYLVPEGLQFHPSPITASLDLQRELNRQTSEQLEHLRLWHG